MNLLFKKLMKISKLNRFHEYTKGQFLFKKKNSCKGFLIYIYDNKIWILKNVIIPINYKTKSINCKCYFYLYFFLAVFVVVVFVIVLVLVLVLFVFVFVVFPGAVRVSVCAGCCAWSSLLTSGVAQSASRVCFYSSCSPSSNHQLLRSPNSLVLFCFFFFFFLYDLLCQCFAIVLRRRRRRRRCPCVVFSPPHERFSALL
jgi:hypothetical protein